LLIIAVQVRREAIQGLDGWTKSQSLKQVILTARKYNIISWLKAAYTQLVDPDSHFPLEDLTDPPAMDWETIAKILHVNLQRKISDYDYPDSCGICGTGRICCGVVDPLIEETFKAEFSSSIDSEDEQI
jgi:hypothetical protein